MTLCFLVASQLLVPNAKSMKSQEVEAEKRCVSLGNWGDQKRVSCRYIMIYMYMLYIYIYYVCVFCFFSMVSVVFNVIWNPSFLGDF